MRLLVPLAALGLTACVATGPSRPPAAPPPPRWAVETRIEVDRDGAAFAQEEHTLWRQRSNPMELEAPEVVSGGAGYGLEISITPDFNLAGEFWGELMIAEFDVLEDGTRVHYLGMPQVFRLIPNLAGAWSETFTGRGGSYSVRLEMDYDPQFKMERARAESFR